MGNEPLRAVKITSCAFALAMVVLLATWQAAAAQEGAVVLPAAGPEEGGILPALRAPGPVRADDAPNDDGSALSLRWELSPDDREPSRLVTEYRIFRAAERGGPFEEVGLVPAGVDHYTDSDVADTVRYFYLVQASDGVRSADSEIVGPARPVANWFHRGRFNILIPILVFSVILFYFVGRATHGIDLFIRRIAGLNAVDEAIGRATEMGRPILFVPGIGDMSYPQTIASVSILRRVARKAAECDTPIIMPNYDPIVFTVAQEVVQSSYVDAGRPDAYNPDSVRFLTSDQFGFAAGVDGIMQRERPATIFLLGYFMAESLILAETGHSTGAIQIAGTAELAQLPFFVTACDYTLIGEELYAASAYLSREPMLVASIKGQDWGKFVIMLLIVVGVVLETLGITRFTTWFTVH